MAVQAAVQPRRRRARAASELSAVRAPDAPRRRSRRAVRPRVSRPLGDRLRVAVAAPADARALLVVSPNNPTGSYVTAREARTPGRRSAASATWALIADEVFADYPLEAANAGHRHRRACRRALVHARRPVEVGRVAAAEARVDGRRRTAGCARRGARRARADRRQLPVGEHAGADRGAGAAARTRSPIRRGDPGARARGTWTPRVARRPRYPPARCCARKAAGRAVVRIPATRSEEQLVLDLLERERILVHPGYFFDFRSRGVHRGQPAAAGRRVCGGRSARAARRRVMMAASQAAVRPGTARRRFVCADQRHRAAPGYWSRSSPSPRRAAGASAKSATSSR